MPERAYAAGVDLGGTKILAHVFDPDEPSRRLAEVRCDTPRGGEQIASAIVGVVEAAAGQLDEQGLGPVTAVGVGAAGLVDAHGSLRYAPNLPGVIEFPLRHTLATRLGVDVVVENDATAATWAEFQVGAAQGCRDMVLVTLGTGIGAGIVAGGVLQRGANGFAGELGHMLVDPAGPPCPCGRRGCWERMASGSGLGRLARDAAHAGRADHLVALAGGDPDAVRGEHVGDAAAVGDPDGVRILGDFAWWVAVGIANVVNMVDPEVVVVGGGLSGIGELLLSPVRSHFDGLVMATEHRRPVRIVRAELGPEAGSVGAWLLATDHVAESARRVGGAAE
ncbi:MAG: ROK family protein [Acidimicrobiia bacterium]|nr:ROK family protein [Acidimicrobiia bacterium]